MKAKKEKLKRIKVGISVGDLNGIGLEVVLKTFSDSRMFQHITPAVYCPRKPFDHYKKKVKQNEFSYAFQKDASRLDSKRLNLIACGNENLFIEFGKPNQDTGELALKSFEKATKDLAEGKVDVLVTAPFNKDTIQKAGFSFPGHTEYLADMAGTEDVLMFLVAGDLRVGIATGHVPLKEVSQQLTVDLIIQKILLMNNSLNKDFKINKPKIAILGLNPHAGDNGAIGEEEEKILTPAIKKLNNELNVLAFGPYASDGFFGSGAFKEFDGVLAMYHDQGLAPFKALTFDSGVNYTAGLPVVRTSPDHGTAYDIAGKGVASEQSFRNAVFLAVDVYKNRIEHKNLISNPLLINPEKKESKSNA